MLSEKEYRKIRRRSEFLCGDGGVPPKYCIPQGATAASDGSDINHEVIRRKIKLHRRTEKVRRLDTLYDDLVAKQRLSLSEYLDENIMNETPKGYVKLNPDKGISYQMGDVVLNEGPVFVKLTMLRQSAIDKYFRTVRRKIKKQTAVNSANDVLSKYDPCQSESTPSQKNLVENKQEKKKVKKKSSDGSFMSNSVFNSVGEISDADVYFPDQLKARHGLSEENTFKKYENEENKLADHNDLLLLSPAYSYNFEEDSDPGTVNISDQPPPSILEDVTENAFQTEQEEKDSVAKHKSFTSNESFNASNNDENWDNMDIFDLLQPSIPQEDAPENVFETEQEEKDTGAKDKSFTSNESFNVSNDEVSDAGTVDILTKGQPDIPQDPPEKESETEKEAVTTDKSFNSNESFNDNDSDADILDITIDHNEFDF